jgi:hypothetical protein
MSELDGLWVFFTMNFSPDPIDFMITGNLGADGGGTVSEYIYMNGAYAGLVKAECGAGDPSVNHLVIVDKTNGMPTQSCSMADYASGNPQSCADGADSNLDDHIVSGIASGSPLLFLIYGGTAGYCMTDAEHSAIFTAALDCIIQVDAGSGVAAGIAIRFGEMDYESRSSTYRIPADGSANFDQAMAAFNDAPVGGDYCEPMRFAAATGMSSQDACGGPNTNIAFHYNIPMTVAVSGTYKFQFHTDWGNNGGFTCFDGVCQHHSGDVWGNIMFEAPLTPGDHMLEMVGFEGCCDGWQTLNVALPAACVATPGIDCGTIVPDWLLVDSTGDTDYTCAGGPPNNVEGQLVTFGCIEHETVQCTYSANANPNQFQAALDAFAECRIATAAAGLIPDSFCTIQTNQAQGLSNQDACGGPNTNIAFHTLIPFSASCEGVYHFRFHADHGLGGYTGIDGVAHTAGDIWGHVHISDVQISVGDHYFEGLGFEGCCDGHSELEIHLPPDGEGDPWRLVVAGPTDTLSGECGATPPPFTPPTGTSSQTCIYSIYGTTSSYPQLSMPAAEDACVQIGGHLASAHSQEDGDLINELVPDGGRAWLGYHDMGFEAGCTDDRHQGIGGNIEAATFVWTDATPSDYEN